MKIKLYREFNGDSDMMSDEEVKQELLDKISDFRKNCNYWSVRDTLTKFTKFGFWSGGEMASVDIETAVKIADELYQYVEELQPGHSDIDEVYELLNR